MSKNRDKLVGLALAEGESYRGDAEKKSFEAEERIGTWRRGGGEGRKRASVDNYFGGLLCVEGEGALVIEVGLLIG